MESELPAHIRNFIRDTAKPVWRFDLTKRKRPPILPKQGLSTVTLSSQYVQRTMPGKATIIVPAPRGGHGFAYVRYTFTDKPPEIASFKSTGIDPGTQTIIRLLIRALKDVERRRIEKIVVRSDMRSITNLAFPPPKRKVPTPMANAIRTRVSGMKLKNFEYCRTGELGLRLVGHVWPNRVVEESEPVEPKEESVLVEPDADEPVLKN